VGTSPSPQRSETSATGGCAASVDQEVDSPKPVHSHIVGYDYPPNLKESRLKYSQKNSPGKDPGLRYGLWVVIISQ